MDDTKVSLAREISFNKFIVLLSFASGATMQSKSLERTTSKVWYAEDFQDKKALIVSTEYICSSVPSLYSPDG